MGREGEREGGKAAVPTRYLFSSSSSSRIGAILLVPARNEELMPNVPYLNLQYIRRRRNQVVK